MLHCLDLTKTDDGRRLGSETEPVGQPECRPLRSVAAHAGLFGCGTLRLDRSDKTLKWEVRSLPVLVARVIPHFKAYPLLSSKLKDFEALR